MPTWQILRPILISTAVWAGIIVLSSYLFGADAASRALLVAFFLSNIAVLTVLGLIALVAIRFKPAGIILSRRAAVAVWFLIRFGLPISYLLLVNGPSGEESTLPGVWKTFVALAAARGPAGRAGAAIAVLICALFIDKALRAIGYPGARVHSERHRRAILLQRLTLAALSAVGMGLAVLAPLGVGGVILLIVGLDLFIGLSIAILSWRFALDVYRTAAVATALREPGGDVSHGRFTPPIFISPHQAWKGPRAGRAAVNDLRPSCVLRPQATRRFSF